MLLSSVAAALVQEYLTFTFSGNYSVATYAKFSNVDDFS